MNPASQIIDLCGGTAAVAQMLSIDRSWVLRWTHPKDKGGTGGLVPARHQAPLLSRARDAGIKLSPEMFFAAADDRAAA